jgi:hypothetical protein
LSSQAGRVRYRLQRDQAAPEQLGGFLPAKKEPPQIHDWEWPGTIRYRTSQGKCISFVVKVAVTTRFWVIVSVIGF